MSRCSRHHTLGLDSFGSVRGVKCCCVFAIILFQLCQFPFQFHPVSQLFLDSVGKSSESFLKRARITVFKFRPFRGWRICFSFLGEFHLSLQSSIKDGPALVPVNAVGNIFDTSNFGQGCFHAQCFWVSSVNSRHKGVYTPKKDFFSQDTLDPLADCFFLVFRRGSVSQKCPNPCTNSTRPTEQSTKQGKLHDAIRAKDQLQLSFGAFSTLSLGQRVQFSIVIDPRRERFISEYKLVIDS
mmetsp:Transcript_23477/g.48743  ORF Transcript_23477/g.48743 Transcript_23477/m.48743 type:complete len:240 (+) Transcript_23477:757-1476(+)